MEENDGGDRAALSAPSRPPPSVPIRPDCWSRDATETLVEAWADRYLELNRGNLRRKHWQEVADAVNAAHGHNSKKACRTDVQCKNRIDTLKKKYKIERVRVSKSKGSFVSAWPFFSRLDGLIGSSCGNPSPLTAPRKKAPTAPSPAPALPPVPSSIPVGRRSKRPAANRSPAVVDDSLLRGNSAMEVVAAVAAKAEESEMSNWKPSAGRLKRERDGEGTEGYGQLADAVERLAKIYERVEAAKQRQFIELEKQRMHFAKDLEIQRIKLFMDSQIHLQNIKRSKQTSDSVAKTTYRGSLKMKHFSLCWRIMEFNSTPPKLQKKKKKKKKPHPLHAVVNCRSHIPKLLKLMTLQKKWILVYRWDMLENTFEVWC